jgi:uncharacterized protein (DUF697 family)
LKKWTLEAAGEEEEVAVVEQALTTLVVQAPTTWAAQVPTWVAQALTWAVLQGGLAPMEQREPGQKEPERQELQQKELEQQQQQEHRFPAASRGLLLVALQQRGPSRTPR